MFGKAILSHKAQESSLPCLFRDSWSFWHSSHDLLMATSLWSPLFLLHGYLFHGYVQIPFLWRVQSFDWSHSKLVFHVKFVCKDIFPNSTFTKSWVRWTLKDMILCSTMSKEGFWSSLLLSVPPYISWHQVLKLSWGSKFCPKGSWCSWLPTIRQCYPTSQFYTKGNTFFASQSSAKNGENYGYPKCLPS